MTVVDLEKRKESWGLSQMVCRGCHHMFNSLHPLIMRDAECPSCGAMKAKKVSSYGVFESREEALKWLEGNDGKTAS